jgi:hypothetical protein
MQPHKSRCTACHGQKNCQYHNSPAAHTSPFPFPEILARALSSYNVVSRANGVQNLFYKPLVERVIGFVLQTL